MWPYRVGSATQVRKTVLEAEAGQGNGSDQHEALSAQKAVRTAGIVVAWILGLLILAKGWVEVGGQRESGGVK